MWYKIHDVLSSLILYYFSESSSFIIKCDPYSDHNTHNETNTAAVRNQLNALRLKDKVLSDDEIIQIMIENPKLIERPIVTHNNLAVVGRPPENILEII